MSRIAFIIAGGGASRRFGGKPKLLCMLEGRPVFCHCLATFAEAFPEASILLTVPNDLIGEFRALSEQYLPQEHRRHLLLIAGGASRAESIWNALRQLMESPGGLPETIAIHDAARPYCTRETLQKCLDALEQDATLQGAVASHPCTDTIHTVTADGIITGTPERATLWCAETPQIFRGEALCDAYRRSDWRTLQPTDDAQLMLQAGYTRIAAIRSTAPNAKITYFTDLP